MENHTTLPKLLEDVKALIAADYAERVKQGKNFNIFDVQGTLHDEVRVCRLLRELLDPQGSHGQGYVFLERFMRDVIKCCDFDVTDCEKATTRVTSEERTDGHRRVDLVIHTAKKIYPIEVKIYAGDQEAQCYDYYQAVKKMYEKRKISAQPILYYLTLDGHEPSDSSKKTLEQGQYKCISFETDILDWLTQCIHSAELEQIYPIREILIQFRDAIKILTGKERGKINMEIKEKINMSKENFLAALQISNTLPEVMADKMIEVFKAIQDHMKEKGYDKHFESETYKSDAIQYYNRNNRIVWPSLSYKIPVSDESLKGKIALRFEIDWYDNHSLYFGILPWDEEEKDNCSAREKTNEGAEYVENYLKPIENTEDDSEAWYWYKFFAEGIDFRSCNEKYKQLYEKGNFTEIMKNIFREIDDAIDKIFNNTKKN